MQRRGFLCSALLRLALSRQTAVHLAASTSAHFFASSASSRHPRHLPSLGQFTAVFLFLISNPASTTTIHSFSGAGSTTSTPTSHTSTMAGVFHRASRSSRRPNDCAAVFVHAGAGYHSVQNEMVHLKACEELVYAILSSLKDSLTLEPVRPVLQWQS